MVFALCACGTKAEAPVPAAAEEASTTYLNDLTLEEIAAKAKETGKLDTVGMPDDWCNYGVLFNALTEEYGLVHTDIDMSSSEQIALFEAEKDDPTKDIGEVGQQNSTKVMDKGVVQAYKPSTWDSVPDWAKDDEGYWMIAYTGTISIMTNVDAVGKEIKSFKEIADDVAAGTCDYKITIGDPTTESSAQHVVLAAAYALGGDVNDLQPAFQFFQDLAKAGALDAGSNEYSRFEKGESTVLFQWDYKHIQNMPENLNVAIHVPSDGSVASGYLTIINRWAPHPEAAALVREWLFSDAGQINVAACGATPVRSDVVIPDGTCPYSIDDAEYANVTYTIEIQQDWITACETLAETWEEMVIPYMG